MKKIITLLIFIYLSKNMCQGTTTKPTLVSLLNLNKTCLAYEKYHHSSFGIFYHRNENDDPEKAFPIDDFGINTTMKDFFFSVKEKSLKCCEDITGALKYLRKFMHAHRFRIFFSLEWAETASVQDIKEALEYMKNMIEAKLQNETDELYHKNGKNQKDIIAHAHLNIAMKVLHSNLIENLQDTRNTIEEK